MPKKKQIFVFIGVAIILLLWSKKSSAANLDPKMLSKINSLVNTYGNDRVQLLTNAYAALQSAGFPSDKVLFALSQAMFETGMFNSNVSRLNNNFSGIMFINNPDKQKNATRGLAYPSNEGSYNYANFSTPKDWAIDFLRILSKGPGYPINQNSVEDWAAALKQNNYFTSSESDYSAGMQRYFNLLV
jgi:hypothetical protein